MKESHPPPQFPSPTTPPHSVPCVYVSLACHPHPQPLQTVDLVPAWVAFPLPHALPPPDCVALVPLPSQCDSLSRWEGTLCILVVVSGRREEVWEERDTPRTRRYQHAHAHTHALRTRLGIIVVEGVVNGRRLRALHAKRCADAAQHARGAAAPRE